MSAMSQPQKDRADKILSDLKGIFARIAGVSVEEVPVDVTLLELGVDSLTMIQATQTIQSTLGLKIPFRVLVENNPTLNDLAAYVDHEMPAGEPPMPPSVESSNASSRGAMQIMNPEQPSVGSNGNEPSEPSGVQSSNGHRKVTMPEASVSRIIARQLEIMSEQLALLRGSDANGNAASPVEMAQSVLPQVEAVPLESAPTQSASSQPPAAAVQVKSETYIPYKPMRVGSGSLLNPRQQQHLDDLIERFSRKTANSKRQAESRRAVLADSRTSAGFRLLWKEMLYTLVAERASGARVWDVDGNEYVDITMGYGALLFGHNPASVEALQGQFKQGVQMGLISSSVGQAAELVRELTGVERVTFCNSGTEAVMIALRLARTVTGRSKIAFFAGSYHGFSDEVLVRMSVNADGGSCVAPIAPGIPLSAADNVLVLEYGNPESLDVLRAQAHELAAVLVEPVQSRRPDFQPVEFLRQLRELTRGSGTALIFDEVITGFRVHPGGIQALFGVEADIVTYGKGIGAGLPVAVVAGKAAYLDAIDGGMWSYGDTSYPQAERTYVAGTYFMHPITMAAVCSSLTHLKNSGARLQEQLNERTAQLAGTLNAYFEQEQIPIQVVNCGSLFRFVFSHEVKLADIFFYHLLDNGVYTWEGRNCFLSTAHTRQDIDFVIAAVKEAASEMRQGGFIAERVHAPEQAEALPEASQSIRRAPDGRPVARQPDGAAAVIDSGERQSVEPSAAPTAAVPRLVATTVAQKELWILTRMGDDASRAYNESVTLHLRGPLDLAAMRRAIQKLTARHEALRTTFSPDGAYQQIHKDMEVNVPLADFTGQGGGERDAGVVQWLAREARRSFDLEQGPLVRFGLARLEDEYHLLALTLHHIITDGWSNGVLIQEIGALYTAECRGVKDPLPPVMGFSEYAELLERRQGSPEMDAAENYWLSRLSDVTTALDLPTDRPRPPVQTYAGARSRSVIETSLLKEIRGVGIRLGSTPFVTLLSAFQLFMHRLSGQDDLVVGISAAGQPYAGDNKLVGYCTNLLPLRSRIDANPAFEDYIASVKKAVLDAYDHQIYPFARLIRHLNVQRDPSRPPLASVIFNMDTKLDEGQTIPGLEVTVTSNLPDAAKYDINLNITQTSEELWLDWEYNTDLFDARTIERWQGHFRTLLESIINDPRQPVMLLPLVGKTHYRTLSKHWNETGRRYDAATTIGELFDRQAALTPQAVALCCEGRQLSYGQLRERSNRLAHYLRWRGVRAETTVGVCLERTERMVEALLGIVKAGGAYVPLDPAYPVERLAFMLSDARPALVLTQSEHRESLQGYGGQVVFLDEEQELISSHPDSTPESGAEGENLAYIVYTSGSTGQPKGVMVTHANVARLFAATEQWFHFDERDVWTLFHSYAFDFSVWELWGALLYGGRLVVVPYLVSRSPADFYELLRHERVTVLNQTPSAFRQLMQVGESRTEADGLALRLVIFGGEALELQMLRPWVSRHGDAHPRLVNMYGISETTVHVTYRPVTLGDLHEPRGSVIGGPIPDLSLHVLDQHMQLIPSGVPGELYVGGDGVARGYLNRPELTAERFVPDPFSERPGARLYRSGDLARSLVDGDTEYLGRADNQVKVRGFRIELGEIEATLRRHEAVRESVVVMREDESGERRLVAYVVTAEAKAVGQLRDYLREKLPEYMIPSAIVRVEELPLTASGKIDRKALPAPESARTEPDDTYTPPRTLTQEIMSAVWSQVLGVYPVGIHDNFFALGGDSIRAIQVLGEAKARGLSFLLPDLFRHPTIGELSQVMATKAVETTPVVHTRPFGLISAPDRERLPADVEDAYPLTMLQSGMLYHMTLTPEASVYHNVNSLRVRGPFDLEAMQQATLHVAAHQPVLRTSFDFGGYSKPLQLVHKSADLPVQFEDLRGLPDAEQIAAIDRYVEEEKTRFFNASTPPLIRIKIHLLKDDEFQWSLTDFHPIIDGWAVAVMLTEISAGYATLLKGGHLDDTPPPPVTFRDYVKSELSILEDEAAREYLARMLSDSTPLRLPRWTAGSGAHGELEIRSMIIQIPDEILAGLQQLARSKAIPLHYVLLAAHMKVMSLLGGQDDVTTGLVMDGRLEEPGGEQVLGLYLNTMPFRVELSPGTWTELVQKVFEAVLSLVPVRRFPLAALQSKWGSAPLFESMFYFIDFHNLYTLSQTGPLKLVEGTHSFNNTHFPFQSMFSLDRAAQSRDSSLKLRLDYDATQFNEAQLDAMSAYYCEALRRIAAEPSSRHDGESLLSEDERHTLLTAWNETGRRYDAATTIGELFDRQAALTPQAVALCCEGRQLSYGQLRERSNRLAHYLRWRGVRAETTVGVCLERTERMVEALLGIVKAGGAYVPLDPAYPVERLAFMLSDARPALVLTQESLREVLGEHEAEVVCLDTDWEERIGVFSKETPESKVTGDSLAYIVYTSGSTGQPKGVLNIHRGAVNRFRWMWETYPFAPGEVCCQKTSLNFVDSVWEIFGPLLQGVPLVVIPDEVVKDPRALIDSLSENNVTRITVVPSFLRVILDSCDDIQAHLPHLKYWTASGEALTGDLLERFRARLPASVLLNLYGSSEVAADVTWCEPRGEDNSVTVPIGRPIANSQIYLLNSDLQPVPIGATGELYVGGAGLARGYHRRAGLTAEKFIPAPFGDRPGTRLYRSGDLARFRTDGTIEYLGRSDHQVKVRGFRIETGEIEAALREHAAVREAVVVARDDAPGGTRLVAYVLTDEAREGVTDRLRSHLAERLPAYMIPSAFVLLDGLPLTPSGKVDRRRLPAPGGELADANEYLAPRNPTEELLADFWAEVLGLERVGVRDNFFELGGHSLLAMQVISRVRQAFRVELSVRRLFERPTIEGFAQSVEAHMSAGEGRPKGSLRHTPLHGGEAPVSFAQQRLWFLDQLRPGGTDYNMPAALRLKGLLDIGALTRSINEIVRRHESLRTTFKSVEGEPVQVIAPHAPAELPTVDLSGLPEDVREAEALRRAREEAARTFDLEHGPLVRAALVRLGDAEHLLLFTMHHIISDGWSLGVLVRELTALYEAFSSSRPSPLEEPPVQYADYAAWQREWLQGEALEAQLSYWREQLEGAPPSLELPTDFPRPDTQLTAGAAQSITLSTDLVAALKALGRREGATLYMTLLAAFQTLLSRYTGQENIVVGTPIAGRRDTQLEGLIGFFVNTLVLRTDLSGDPTFAELLGRVREVCLDAYAHQDVPFERLVEELQPERSLSRTPLFQVMFTLQNAPQGELRLPGLTLERLAVESDTTKFDLSFSATESDGQLYCVLHYKTALFAANTAVRMLAHFEVLLRGATANPEGRAAVLPYLTRAEERLLLGGWNQTGRDYPRGDCLHELFERQAERTPGAVAVRSGEEQLTYAELNERADRLARHLRAMGVGPETFVGLLTQRTPGMVVGLLAVLKAGSAYVPLDPNWPKERLALMIADARVSVLLTEAHCAGLLPEHDAHLVLLDSDPPSSEAEGDGRHIARARPENPAYVIFTSGSTGTPKGVVVEHRQIVNYVRAIVERVGLEPGMSFAMVQPLTVDSSQTVIFPALFVGGTIHLLSRERAADPVALGDYFERNRIDCLKIAPSYLAALQTSSRPERLMPRRRLVIGGEASRREWAEGLGRLALGCAVFNHYGPTEATVGMLTYRLPAEATPHPTRILPMGLPLANTRAYVLDRNMSPVAVGVPGELYIGGECVARGYLNRAAATAERFVPDPFSPEPGARLYRTGDVVRRLPDGHLLFVGRDDHQVKIRGFRIELGEVEAVLEKHPMVRCAVVTALEETPGDKFLAAYVVAHEGHNFDAEILRSYLKAKLPEHSVPWAFVALDELPLTASGKVNRRALPALREVRRSQTASYVAPRNPTEELLAQIWASTLGLERVGIHDNFFELGGHSLLAMRVVAGVRSTFQLTLSLLRVFEAPTVAEMAQLIEDSLIAEIEGLTDDNAQRLIGQDS